MDTSIMAEIAKHLPFRMKLAARLCCRRCHQFIRIYIIPEGYHSRLNNERIALFPHLRELHYRLNSEAKYPYDQSWIAKMELESFVIDGVSFGDQFDFNMLASIGKSLKRLFICDRTSHIIPNCGDYDSSKQITDVLPRLNNINRLMIIHSGIMERKYDTKHLKLETLYFSSFHYYTESKYAEHCQTIKHMRNSTSGNHIDLSVDYPNLRSAHGFSVKDVYELKADRLHSLGICFYELVDFEDIRRIIKRFKLHSLDIMYDCDFYNRTHYYKIPIDTFIGSGIRHIYLADFTEYDAEEMRLLEADGICVEFA